MKTPIIALAGNGSAVAASVQRHDAAAAIGKLLVANRGEIACRILRTARRMGIPTVAVHSEADDAAQHVLLADEAVCIGAQAARESYLDGSRILDACRHTGARAVHPGYGFLSESAAFARAVEEAGLVFVGPGHDCIARLGDKIAARTLAIAAGVAVIPGWNAAIASRAEAVLVCRELGYPVMLKASAGGGGRGLRIVHEEADLPQAFDACRSEALLSFGDDRVFAERLVPNARHVEVQVLADGFGNCVHLWERECSIQRRHQKLIEEAPCAFLDETTRLRMCEQAVALARAAGYRSAGTVEFLVGADGAFHFLEMNTRLQVEHPVTECVTGIDLVEQMIRVAAGERLGFDQSQVQRHGWAMECRINAEDPARGFLPSSGRLVRYQPPEQTLWASQPVASTEGVRVDGGVREGDVVSSHYDSLLAKLIVHGRNRGDCIRTMQQALDAFLIRGVSTNLAFHAAVLAHPDFRAARFTTAFVAEHHGGGAAAAPDAAQEDFLVALGVAVHARFRQRAVRISGQLSGHEARWDEDLAVLVTGGSGGAQPRPVRAEPQDGGIMVRLGDAAFPMRLHSSLREPVVRGDCAGTPFVAQVERVGLAYRLSRSGACLEMRVLPARAARLAATMPPRAPKARIKALLSPMSGRLVELAVKPGTEVRAGERLAVIEAMKMENVLVAAEDGIVASVEAGKGQSLTVDQVILRFR